MDIARLISSRANSVEISGIRRFFEAAGRLDDPINLSIGQPDFPVPDEIKRAAIEAIERDRNGYTPTTGVPALCDRVAGELVRDCGWPDARQTDSGVGAMIVSGTSGALFLLMQALLDEGDEIVIPDPYFVAYPWMAAIAGGRAVRCATAPDFRMTAERVAPLITDRTKAVLVCSPGNPTGVTLTAGECEGLLALCRERGVLLVSDEIYDMFVYADAPRQSGDDACAMRRAPSAARLPGAHEDVLLIRGFGKTFGCTGWRMGYIAGPSLLVEQFVKLQQYSFVCAPSTAQWGCLAAFDLDVGDLVARYQRRRDMVVDALAPLATIARPTGAFYAFVELPAALQIPGEAFAERLLERNVVVIPGGVFSDRDTHFRISYSTSEERLAEGLGIITEELRKG